MSKKILSVLLAAFMLIFSVVPCFAVEYGTEFPSYVTYSGGAYFEVKSTLGQIAFVCPNTYKSGYFGFIGSGNNICNLSNSTVSGYIYTTSGTSYSARFSSLGTLQYRTDSSSYYEWQDITITEILNTNVTFVDEKGDRQTDNYFLDKEDIFLYSLLFVIVACSVLGLFLPKKRGSR